MVYMKMITFRIHQLQHTLVVENINLAPDDLCSGSGEDLPEGGLDTSSSATVYSIQYGLSGTPREYNFVMRKCVFRSF